MTPAQRLREVLAAPGLEVMPGCFDALSAKLVADAGFKVTFMSGFAVSAARLGLPDTGLISFAEMLDSLRNCASGAARIPLIGDGDTGYGNALNVQRTVVEYARAGAAAVTIEDQVSPKKCGHTRGKLVIPREEARMKIRAAVDARRDADILILARTDARAVHGFDEALDRCRDFEMEGADIIFLEAAALTAFHMKSWGQGFDSYIHIGEVANLANISPSRELAAFAHSFPLARWAGRSASNPDGSWRQMERGASRSSNRSPRLTCFLPDRR